MRFRASNNYDITFVGASLVVKEAAFVPNVYWDDVNLDAEITSAITVGVSSASSWTDASKGIVCVGGFVGYADDSAIIGNAATSASDASATSVKASGTVTINGSYFLGGVTGCSIYGSYSGVVGIKYSALNIDIAKDTYYYRYAATITSSITTKNPTQGHYAINNGVIPFETSKDIGSRTELSRYKVVVNGTAYTKSS